MRHQCFKAGSSTAIVRRQSVQHCRLIRASVSSPRHLQGGEFVTLPLRKRHLQRSHSSARKLVVSYQKTFVAPLRGATFTLPIDYTQVHQPILVEPSLLRNIHHRHHAAIPGAERTYTIHDRGLSRGTLMLVLLTRGRCGVPHSTSNVG